MSPIKEYIQNSLLVPPDIKAILDIHEAHALLEDDMVGFIQSYAPLEEAILCEVNRELEALNTQVKQYLKQKEWEARDQEIREAEQAQEMVYA